MKIQLNTECTEYVSYKKQARYKQPYLSLPHVSDDGDYKYNYSEMIVIYFCKHCGAELVGHLHMPEYKVYMGEYISTGDFEEALHNNDFEKFNQLIEKKHFIEHGKYSKAQFTEAYEFCKQIESKQINAIEEFDRLSKIKTCPCCHTQLSRDVGFYVVQSCGWEIFKGKPLQMGLSLSKSYDELINKMQQARIKNEKAQAAKAIQAKIAQYECSAPIEKTPMQASIKDDPEKLKNYIQNLIQVETNILFLTKRLTALYEECEPVERKANGSTLHLMIAANDCVKTAKQDLLACKNQLSACEKTEIAQPNVPMPSMPKKPTEPLYATPGFFNKKRVLAENEQLKLQYEQTYAQYEADMEEYKQALVIREQKIIQLMKRQEEQHTKDVDDARKKVKNAEDKLSKAEASLQETFAAIQELATPEKAYKLIRDDEIRQTEELLEKAIHCKHQLYDCGIIFMKYHNLVAISTFYEYLMSGRCTSLEGANGAYNIYEAEVRANTIIDQLNGVLESLEKVKENQYMIYQSIQRVNSNLYRLEDSMNTMSKSLEHIDAKAQTMTGYMEKIAKNSDVIAHNTSVTAHYSKITAELTNALGYMVALS